MNTAAPDQITAQSLYQVWSTEPDHIKIVDVRSQQEFSIGHIPDSLHRSLTEIANILRATSNDILIVLVMAPEQIGGISSEISHHENIVILANDLKDWKAQNYPMAKVTRTQEDRK